MILTILLYVSDLLQYALGVTRRGREKEDHVGEVGKRYVCMR